jgi:ATP-dependent RNA helicase DDX19/DBP5
MSAPRPQPEESKAHPNEEAKGSAASCIYLTTEEGETFYASNKTWPELMVMPEIIENLENKGWNYPTLIQGAAIPIILSGGNLIAQSKNGTGKTGAFVVGVLSRIDPYMGALQAICFSHTRELNQQNYAVFSDLAKGTGINVGIVEKGDREIPTCHVLCGTVGTLTNLIRDPSVGRMVKSLIYDEADFLFEQKDTVSRLVKMKKNIAPCQQLLFSATFSQNVWKFIQSDIPSATSIRIEKEEDLNLDNVDQFVIQCEHEKKFQMLSDILKKCSSIKSCIVFINTKNYLDRVYDFLTNQGVKVLVVAAGRVEDDVRDEIIQKMREGKVRVLLTTDVLSRGVDFRLVNLVINLDPPYIFNPNREQRGPREADPVTYLHRVGRTGRYGRRGIAVNLVSDHHSQQAYISIQNHYGTDFRSADVDEISEFVEKQVSDYQEAETQES